MPSKFGAAPTYSGRKVKPAEVTLLGEEEGKRLFGERVAQLERAAAEASFDVVHARWTALMIARVVSLRVCVTNATAQGFARRSPPPPIDTATPLSGVGKKK